MMEKCVCDEIRLKTLKRLVIDAISTTTTTTMEATAPLSLSISLCLFYRLLRPRANVSTKKSMSFDDFVFFDKSQSI